MKKNGGEYFPVYFKCNKSLLNNLLIFNRPLNQNNHLEKKKKLYKTTQRKCQVHIVVTGVF